MSLFAKAKRLCSFENAVAVVFLSKNSMNRCLVRVQVVEEKILAPWESVLKAMESSLRVDMLLILERVLRHSCK